MNFVNTQQTRALVTRERRAPWAGRTLKTQATAPMAGESCCRTAAQGFTTEMVPYKLHESRVWSITFQYDKHGGKYYFQTMSFDNKKDTNKRNTPWRNTGRTQRMGFDEKRSQGQNEQQNNV
jgi:hypothetical protein